MTSEVLSSLAKQGLPDAVLAALATLKDKKIKSKKSFLNRLGQALGQENLSRYQDIVLSHASHTEPIDRPLPPEPIPIPKKHEPPIHVAEDIPTALRPLAERIGQQLQCIRNALNERDGAPFPYRHRLLLDERRILFEWVGRIYLVEGWGLPEGVSEVRATELLEPWTEFEQDQKVGSREFQLNELWLSLANAAARPALVVTSAQIEEAAGLGKATWNQYVKRARQKVVAVYGIDECRELFRYWPEGVFSHGAVP